MHKGILAFALSVSCFSFAAEEGNSDVGVIITNYSYDQWGRPIRSSQVAPYYNNSPYGNTYYNDPYYPTNLPGLDPNRQEDIFEQNKK